MTLSVIGSGFGRTGTLSLKGALERLDLGPCYHMLEVMRNPDHVPVWGEAVAGRPVDWEALLGGYGCAVDWPACSYWRELAARFPDAKILHSVRDPERWYDSVHDTIYQILAGPTPPPEPAFLRPHHANNVELILRKTFHDRFADRAYAIGVYEQHTETVRREVPAERLLIFDVRDGWEPLCDFLDRPIPDEPFPRVNSKDEFRARFLLAKDDESATAT